MLERRFLGLTLGYFSNIRVKPQKLVDPSENCPSELGGIPGQSKHMPSRRIRLPSFLALTVQGWEIRGRTSGGKEGYLEEGPSNWLFKDGKLWLELRGGGHLGQM